MADTPVTGSYINTLEIALAYFAGDPRAVAFIAAPATMAWYLKRATKIIDNLPLKGSTYYEFVSSSPIVGQQQDRQFPRYIDGMCYGYDINSNLPEVPQEVLDACCEEALAIYLHLQDPMSQEVEKMQRRGATAASIGGEGSESWQQGARRIRRGLKSEEAWSLLSGYLAGATETTF